MGTTCSCVNGDEKKSNMNLNSERMREISKHLFKFIIIFKCNIMYYYKY